LACGEVRVNMGSGISHSQTVRLHKSGGEQGIALASVPSNIGPLSCRALPA
jgi:hypothetical protein